MLKQVDDDLDRGTNQDTGTVTGVPPSALPSSHQGVRATPGQVVDPHKRTATQSFLPHHEGKSPSTAARHVRQGVLHPQGLPSATPDSSSLPLPLETPEQCQAPSISDIAPPLALIPVPGPELVPVADPNHVTDPPTGDPPNLTNLVIANRGPPTPDVSSSHSLSSAKDESLADLNITPSLVDQELSNWDANTGSTLMMVVSAAGVGSLPIATRTTSDPAPDGTSGLSPGSVPSSPLRNSVARPWSNLKKKKKEQKRSS
ncbi:putative uncharacterized protein DDB_G0290521 [Macrobrachium rosenbergii]|uniref:putative uncharacterized protein DDB_G0290521 n=1 Tax=Macrobrachium rosenbergii TaxID=79674 RepID=UPI0034D45C4F